ncbi:MAG: hypothetical protein DRJ65_19245 [Acidobacteria bacterium]|nr:MAG: hypothetical protein DRJ65_19245 [Acidobacteriota bacterium]
MRNIQSCVVRWLVDSDHPSDFRGNVHRVDDGKRLSFRGERDLLRVLRQFHGTSLPKIKDQLPGEEQ